MDVDYKPEKTSVERLQDLYTIQANLIESNPHHPDIVARIETAGAIRVGINAINEIKRAKR